ncbi:TerC family protein [Nitrosococcus oceani]|uniref:Integral membrane protein TerC n=2 Tax=Nitrosococcus oceani TaxID=1229 RepID=Q3J902_NITOC|nr:TerC family protein [Nitrosococcus oceani]KFI18877.1 membrane protein [Nitrosococcus oceani C-27]ABA58694.1 Integral membrane protein TerC [Nitrosococcus oceani ATCC 19707]EDZ67036.1 Integral membrane protein TerC family [Nitrosococcus oceani AFC27]KFI22114.1 membrane protein [Nitrosococcus oceani]GEM19217.1 membrane protein [Nitrosococcus oceani]
MEWIADPQAWIALATLTALEVVLGIDNIIFISILVSRLPLQQRDKARIAGLSLAMGMRIALLLSLAWVMGLTTPLFSILGEEITGREIILIGGGLFLLAKSTIEIHNSLEGTEEHTQSSQAVSFGVILAQIAVLDIVFSLDSVITAIGMVSQIPVMVIAIVIAILIMMVASKSIGEFVDTHPTIKMLALSFLVLIGVTLIAEGFELHIPKGYIYFSMAFSVAVEMLNLRRRKKQQAARSPIKLYRRL